MTTFEPEAIVHFAEQRSAPYSMIDRKHAVFTQVNNVTGTLNLLYAIRELVPDCHLVKLGTMGEYGTPNIDIEEGYIEIEHNGRKDVLAVPQAARLVLSPVEGARQPQHRLHLQGLGNSRHRPEPGCGVWNGDRRSHAGRGARSTASTTTKCSAQCSTASARRRRLGYPLTVYGKGGQTRGFLDIRDTVRCVEIACQNPAKPGEFRVFNQFTEQFTVLQLAEMVQESRQGAGLTSRSITCPIRASKLEEHYYNAKHSKLIDLGLEAAPLVRIAARLVDQYRDSL